MSDQSKPEPHPALQQYDELAWAVWVESGRKKECIPVKADSEKEAKQKAAEKADFEPESFHVDGPFGDAEPCYFEYEYRMEKKERVVVAAPTEEYAEEIAENERTYDGELIQTTHTDVRKTPIKEIEENTNEDEDQENNKA